MPHVTYCCFCRFHVFRFIYNDVDVEGEVQPSRHSSRARAPHRCCSSGKSARLTFRSHTATSLIREVRRALNHLTTCPGEMMMMMSSIAKLRAFLLLTLVMSKIDELPLWRVQAISARFDVHRSLAVLFLSLFDGVFSWVFFFRNSC